MACLINYVILAVVIHGAAAHQPSYGELDEWIVRHGGEVNTFAGVNHNGVRGLMASRAMKAGDVADKIPVSTILRAGNIQGGSFLDAPLAVLAELQNPDSRYAPYLQTLPRPDEVLAGCNFPEGLVHMLESDYWEASITGTQAYLQAALDGDFNEFFDDSVVEMLSSKNITIEGLKYGCAVSHTRVLESNRGVHIMVPVFDLLNHKRLCPHTVIEDHENNELRIVIGQDVEAGEELCYSYGRDMRDDYAVATYGFLPEEEDPPRLFYVDHPDLDPSNEQYQELSEEPFAGDPEELQGEISRLAGILEDLEERDAARPPHERSPRGEYVWDMMIALQQRRRRAIRHEIARLEHKLASYLHLEM